MPEKLLALKHLPLLGVGMVVGKIAEDPNWRMLATIVGIVGPILFLFHELDTRIDGEVEKQIRPLNVAVSYLETQANKGARFTMQDWREGRKELMEQIEHNRTMISNCMTNFAELRGKHDGN